MIARRFLTATGVFCCLLWWSVPAEAATATAPPITFDTFNGVYYLSRDSRGLSLLTSEETIVADFPASGYTGITRAIPTSYEGRSVNVKILNVTDVAGNSMPYRTSSRENGNLALTIGDPAITLSGPQTIHLNYQTSGVINLDQRSDSLVLDVNGRGWGQSFNSVTASLTIPNSLINSLKGNPTCYTVLGSSDSSSCQISTQKTTQSIVVSAKTGSVVPHQALVVRVGFKPATFSNARASVIGEVLEGIGAVLGLLLAVGLFNLARQQPTAADSLKS